MSLFFFLNDTATTEIYTLSLHDALPIWVVPAFSSAQHPADGLDQSPDGEPDPEREQESLPGRVLERPPAEVTEGRGVQRSEEHTSELQSLAYLVCRLLLENKHNNTRPPA